MAKWEIIEDNKFKKQAGGKSPATRIVTTKNSKNNPKMLPEVTVVEPKAVTKNKPVIQKPNLAPYYVPAQDASKVNQPYYEKKVIENQTPEYIPLKQNNNNNTTKIIVPDLKERDFKKNYPTSKINFNNNLNLINPDSFYYGVPYKNGEIADKGLWNKNKILAEEESRKSEHGLAKSTIDIGQTAANLMELYPPTIPLGIALNKALTIPSVALNLYDRDSSGIGWDAVGLIPGNILPPVVDLGKTAGELSYNVNNVHDDYLKDLKNIGKQKDTYKQYEKYKEIPINQKPLIKQYFQTGGAAATRAAAVNKFNIPVIKTPFSNLTPTSTYKEPSTVLIKDNRKINPVTNTPIKPTRDLKSGNYSASVVDAIISQAINNDVDPYKALAVGLQESKLDSEVGHAKDYSENSFYTDPEKLNQMTQEQKLAFTMVNAIKDKEEYAKKLGYNDDEHYLQAYNGFGKLTPNTEKKYHNSLGVGTNSFYGIDVTKNPIDTAKNPVYGKTVLSLANMLKTNPTITERIGAYNTFNNLLDKSPIGLIKQPFKNGGVIEDPMGQWAHPGSVTRIPSNQITMQGVDYPLLGISDTGHTQMMYPGEDYSFRGKSVTEYPMMGSGGEVNFTYAGENHRVYEKVSPTGNGKGIEGHIMVNHPTENKGKWDTIDLTKITNGKVKTVAQGVASTKKWHKENPEYANGGRISSWEIIEDTPQFQKGGKTKKSNWQIIEY